MKIVNKNEIDPGSFRDPSGFIFVEDGEIYRQVNLVYKEHYDHLMHSGLYDKLTGARLMVSHEEMDQVPARTDAAYKIIKPQRVSFLSYPYEWSFSQLKDAALTTMEILKIALQHDMILKDSSAFNIQFVNGKPIFIDTLSFERYREGEPWVAYRQFCQNFLAPLALMSCKDIRLNQLFRIYIDGIPLDLASELLPFRSLLRFSLLTHIHLHSKSQKRYAERPITRGTRKVGKFSLMGILDSLESAIRALQWDPPRSQWSHYYENTNYSEEGLANKKRLVSEFLSEINPTKLWDLGANTGLFSRIAVEKEIETIAFDSDPVAVELNYREQISKGETRLLPLVLDLSNPSPGIGYENQERKALLDRGPADCIMALALIHHLAISNNVPFGKIAGFFSKLGNSLIVEFVPKSDSQVKRLLAAREDIFTDYDQENFENQFGRYFVTLRSENLKDSERVLYLMKKR
ncbi:MAG TPA: SAM-dependent methyltransferase [Acidobacteriota bacterium]|nr:SAM-dependent methyltransferase [Acidobacteriota bacterium]